MARRQARRFARVRKRVIAGSMPILLLAIVAILLVDRDHDSSSPWRRHRRVVCCSPAAAERAYLVLGCLIGATGGPLQAASRTLADTDGAERPHRAIFRAVRADRKGHLVRRAAADRNHHRGDRRARKPGWRCWWCFSWPGWRCWGGYGSDLFTHSGHREAKSPELELDTARDCGFAPTHAPERPASLNAGNAARR